MNFVIDMGVGKTIEDYLASIGNTTLRILDENMEMPDDEIIHFAVSKNAVIVTMDKDFGELIFKNKIAHTGVLLLRLEDADNEEKLSAIQHILSISSPTQLQNNFCVYKNGKLRINSI